MKLNLGEALDKCVSNAEKRRLTQHIENALIEEALQVQDACNLSGVVHSFNDGVSLLWDIARINGKGTDWVNQHRYCRLFASKIQSLSGDIQANDFDKTKE